MDLISQVTLMGGACDRATIVAARGRAEVEDALASGTLVRTARGRVAVATSPAAIQRASAVVGVLSHRSAAQHWGWAQKCVPVKPEVTVARSRHLSVQARKLILPHWSDLAADDSTGLVTTPHRTLVDCMRNLAPDESLAIVDSALRADDISYDALGKLAESTKGRGRTRIQSTAAAATPRAANPFESALRSQANMVPGLNVKAQLPIRLPGTGIVLHPDLADPVRRIMLEAEGFEWHGESAALTRDCRRYNQFTVLGWIVIRFSWYLVMFEPAYVQQVLREAVAQSLLLGHAQHANVA